MPSANATEWRAQLRKQFRLARNGLDSCEQALAAKQVCQHLLSEIDDMGATHIGVYLANDGEVDLAPLIAACFERLLYLYLPQLHPVNGNSLIFCSYHHEQELVANRFGIPEPPLACHHIKPLAELDLLLMPLVAFDKRGNRLGMGGGFYDRTLSGHQIGRPKLLGIAHDCQQADALPIESWDIPLDRIVTPTRLITP